MKHLLPWCLLIVGLSWAGFAHAQGFGRPGGGMGPSGGGQQKSEKEGVAEAAPEEKEGEPEMPPLPAWPGQETKKLQIFQAKGYFRFRWYMHHNLTLGMTNTNGLTAPYYNPISEDPASVMSCSQRQKKTVPGGGDRNLGADGCLAKTLGGADMRLRIEPTINISETVRIHTQFDIFDNITLGSTPAVQSGTTQSQVPVTAFTETQGPVISGQNSNTAAIVVKRAWAEVGTPFGQLRFGRMPSHWGLGILANDGSCWNCNGGDNQDRLMFTTNLVGHTFGVGYDFAYTGPNLLTLQQGSGYYGLQAIDLEKLDDVHQFFLVAGKIDPEEVIKDKVDRGELVLNYGLYFVWRKQDFDYAYTGGVGLNKTAADYSKNMIERHAWMLIPDLWFKLMWKKLYIELEGVFVGGRIANLSTTTNESAPASIVQFAWALRSRYSFLRDSLKVGLDLGMASGDSDEAWDTADFNRRRIDNLRYDTNGTLREFRFNYDYQIDLILFRELLGTVSNAFYFKPWVQYNVIDSFGARFDMIYSVAADPIGFPGNKRNLGLELDLDIFYRAPEDGFYAGLAYGVLFPLAAIGRPGEIFGSRAFDSEVAHTLQARLIVKF
jgi:uncharacterized protein (TIGR04551 family)